MKNRVLIISIFIVTFLLVSIGIFFGLKYLNPSNDNKSIIIPALTSATLLCSSADTNKSLTLNWISPSSATADMKVSGNIIDTTTNTTAFTLPLLNINQNIYTWEGANGTDKYKINLWLQDPKGAKGTVSITNEIDSSECTSGTQPIAQSTQTPTDTPTPSTTQTITNTPTSTPTDTSTPTTTTTLTETPTTTSSDLPGTADEGPIFIILMIGGIFTLVGIGLFFKEKLN